jgi:hypothetical protein
LFDALPADQATVAATFRTIGERMWDDANTPRNLFVILAGHGTRTDSDPPTKTLVRLADANIYDDVFVAEFLNRINDNSHGGSPIRRLDLITTICYGGGLIDDLRDNFHAFRGSTWPDAEHISILSSGDCYDVTSAGFAWEFISASRGDPNGVPDLNGDGVRSVYDYYDHSARWGMMNPEDPYTPWVPETIYVRGENFFIKGWQEHALYYEWNAPAQLCELTIDCRESAGHVDCVPVPDDANAPRYPRGTVVELMAVPTTEYNGFKRWLVFDPAHPDDVNHVSIDANNPLTLTVDADRHVSAVFGCGIGTGMTTTVLLAVSLTLAGFRALMHGRRRAPLTKQATESVR